MHEPGSHVNCQPETSKPASAFQPAGYGIGKGDFFLCDSQDHLARLYDDKSAVFNVNCFGNILEMRIFFYVVDF